MFKKMKRMLFVVIVFMITLSAQSVTFATVNKDMFIATSYSLPVSGRIDVVKEAQEDIIQEDQLNNKEDEPLEGQTNNKEADHPKEQAGLKKNAGQLPQTGTSEKEVSLFQTISLLLLILGFWLRYSEKQKNRGERTLF